MRYIEENRLLIKIVIKMLINVKKKEGSLSNIRK